MSEGNTPERAKVMRAMGAIVHLVRQKGGGRRGQVSGEDLERVEERARELEEGKGYFRGERWLARKHSFV